MNHQRIVAELLLLAEMFDAELSETKITGYLDALSDLPDDDLIAAMHESVKHCKFFPRVAEIREIVLDRWRETEKKREVERRGKALEKAQSYRTQWEQEQRSLPRPIPIKAVIERLRDEPEENETGS